MLENQPKVGTDPYKNALGKVCSVSILVNLKIDISIFYNIKLSLTCFIAVSLGCSVE